MAARDTLQGTAQEAARASQQWATERWTTFRASSPYFQAKVGLVAAYVVIVALTLLLAPPPPVAWRVRQDRLNFGLSFKTFVEIENGDNGDLEDVVVEVVGKAIEFDGKERPGRWRTKPMALPEGVPTRVFSEQLADERGVAPPYSLVVDSVRVLDGDDTLHSAAVPVAAGALVPSR
jgi:hypothetical protein